MTFISLVSFYSNPENDERKIAVPLADKIEFLPVGKIRREEMPREKL